MESNIYFFFIDDQGSINNDQKWLFLGGLLISVQDYHNLSRAIKVYNKEFLGDNNIKEIKWSDLSSAMYLKSKNQPIKKSKSFAYLENFNVQKIKKFVEDFFELLNRYNYQIILSISHKDYLKSRQLQKIVNFQIENLLERVQFEIQNSNSLAIFVHDAKSTRKDNQRVKDIYKLLMDNSKFVKDYKNIIDNLFIENSHFNSGIQASDFIIGAISGMLRGYEFSKNLYKNYLKQKIRKSYTGEIIGFGILPTGLTKNEKFKSHIKKILTEE